MIIRGYREGDLGWIRKRVDVMHAGHFSDEHVAALSRSFTIMHNDYPVSVTGCFEIWMAVWTCWMIVSDDVRECGLGFARRTREVIKIACEANGIKRLEANVDASIEENVRFARLMGFEVEALKHNAGPGAYGDIIGLVYWHGGRPHGSGQTKGPGD